MKHKLRFVLGISVSSPTLIFMDSKRIKVYLLLFLVFLLCLLNYSFLDDALNSFLQDSEEVFVERVIDGDTIVASSKNIRLLGINCPEKGEEYFEEASEFLEKRILNKTVELRFENERYDKYNRVLAYVFLNEKNVNLELVEKGFANFYFPSKESPYQSFFEESWENCLNSNLNLCEKSLDSCSNCIILDSFDFEKETFTFSNLCSFSCNLTNWKVKGQGRKYFIFPSIILFPSQKLFLIVGEGKNNSTTFFWEEDSAFINRGDTLFLRDSKNKLVLWKNYKK
jgi:endonuclease YncB( thermonuclease family)